MTAEPLTPQLRPLGVGEILDVGIKIYLRNWLALWKIVVFVVLPAQILVNLVSASAVSKRVDTFELNPQGQPVSIEKHDLTVVLVGGLLGALIGYIAGLLAQAACFRAVADAYLGEQVNWRASLRFALRRIPGLVLLSIATSIVILVGFVLCIVPGVYFWVAYSVAVPVLLVEGSGAFPSMGRARGLVKGRWWGTAGVAVVGYVLIAIVSSGLTFVVVGVAFAHPEQNTASGFVLNTLASTVASMLTTPAAAAFATVLYIDLRVRKEGFDLLLLARGLGTEVVPTGGVPSFFPPAPPSSQPPFWPPPPGWTPGPAAEPAPAIEPSSGSQQPPFWPPPAGWTPGPPAEPAPETEPSPGSKQPPFWPPPPGWQPGDS